MKEIKSIEVTPDKVRMVVGDRTVEGRLRSTRQMTFRRRDFEIALMHADMIVPWQAVGKDQR